MQGGSDRLHGRRFTVVNVGSVQREAIRGAKKGILKFSTGNQHFFIYNKTPKDQNAGQEKLVQGETYTLYHGIWDSIVIKEQVIRIIKLERANG
jgi:hypothetical protein